MLISLGASFQACLVSLLLLHFLPPLSLDLAFIRLGPLHVLTTQYPHDHSAQVVLQTFYGHTIPSAMYHHHFDDVNARICF